MIFIHSLRTLCRGVMSHMGRRNWGNTVYGRVVEGLLRQEKDVFSIVCSIVN